MQVKIRKTQIILEEINHEGGPVAEKPVRRGAIMCVIENPFAGKYHEDIQGFMKTLEPLGAEMASRLIAAMGASGDDIESYGKGAIIGEAGEIEHGALWHVPGGYAMRDAVTSSKAIVPSAKKVGGPGTRIDIPLTHANASYVRSHYDAMELGIPDAPRSREMVLILAMSIGGRVHARVGGLGVEDVKGEDGLR